MGKIRIKQIDLSLVGADQRVRPRVRPQDQRVRPKIAKLKGKGGGRIVSMDQTAEVSTAPATSPTISLPDASHGKHRQTPKRQPKFRSRKYKLALIDIDKNKAYPAPQAVRLVKKVSYSRFNGSVELHLNLIDTNIPQSFVLPHPIKRTIKILVFTDDDKLAEHLVTKYGDIITSGGADLINQIKNSNLSINQYNFALATPGIVPKLPAIARLLGPKGLMPNPKNKTITNNPAQKIDELLKGSLNLKPEPKHPLLHLVIGKVNDEEKNLLQNLEAVLKAVGSQKIKKAVLAPTMGPGIRIQIKN